MYYKEILIILFISVFIFNNNANAEKIRSEVDLVQHAADIDVQLKKPKGDGPFPAVVIMHPCQGLIPSVKQSTDSWAAFLSENGFVTLIVDSFTARGKSGGEVCEDYNEMEIGHYYRTWDAFAAHEYLDSLPYVNDDIYLIGQSQGGRMAINVARTDAQKTYSTDRQFAAAAALYPWCESLLNEEITFSAPLLVLAGEKDNWCPAEQCTRAESMLKDDMLKVIVYPNAHHFFDSPLPVGQYLRHTVGRNEAAHDDSKKQILSFFRKHTLK